MNRLTTEEFIRRGKKIHNNKYDYSKVIYKGSTKKVCIICPEHGEFWQNANSHLMGSGCPFCYNDKRKYNKLKTNENFIQESIVIHKNKYDYSKTLYEKDNKKVCIICPEHGEFWQTPNAHLHGQGCPQCGYNKTQEFNKTKFNKYKNEFIEKLKKLENKKYDYSKVEYKGTKTKVCIVCPEHGEFWQTPSKLFTGHFCPKCGHMDGGKKLSDTKDSFIEKARKIHGNRYNYSKVKYVNNHTKVCIICPEHGEFWQTPNSHLFGNGCNKCTQSHLENEIELALTINNIIFEKQKTFKWLKYKGLLKLDFYLPEYNMAIECQGIQHFYDGIFFGSKNNQYKNIKIRDEIKFNLCKENGINLIYYTNIVYTYQYLNKIFYNKNELINYIIK